MWNKNLAVEANPMANSIFFSINLWHLYGVNNAQGFQPQMKHGRSYSFPTFNIPKHMKMRIYKVSNWWTNWGRKQAKIRYEKGLVQDIEQPRSDECIRIKNTVDTMMRPIPYLMSIDNYYLKNLWNDGG